MANTMTLIASSTVGSGGSANITFSSIAATFTDLCVKFSIRTNRSAVNDGLDLTFNSNNLNYTYLYLLGDGSSASSATGSAKVFAQVNGNTSTASTFGNGEVYIPNYASSNNKSFGTDSVAETNATAVNAWLGANLWTNSSAITSIVLTPQLGTSFNEYTTAYLYGVKNA
jgi:hypothetical protein